MRSATHRFRVTAAGNVFSPEAPDTEFLAKRDEPRLEANPMHERVMLLVRDLQPLERLFTLPKGDIRFRNKHRESALGRVSIEATTFLASTSLRADAYVCASSP